MTINTGSKIPNNSGTNPVLVLDEYIEGISRLWADGHKVNKFADYEFLVMSRYNEEKNNA